ncbi:cytochrome c oxidase subunit II [Wenzhouxiangella marina]|uniref:Cytochrome c oxidase subunit 2 n=1 Tax=Wenzhouxiangella marina TaxID=1579979 RepID=A0A0K0XW77_9GAMM|nr:cytochrome c oxidase subunit II [Wenzhouxiangella marina]AKS41959.1 Cytochrome c oxidase subunit 2 [Wenzhouxiangella marina]MBB6086274.1 cytochrome c oxidase subunit 2 [Wenzhouxiangella marina]
MKRTNELIVALAVMAVIVVVTWGLFAVGDNMSEGVTPFSKDVYQLHNQILGIVTIIGVLVFTAMFTSIIVHRKSRGHEPAKFSHSTKAEILWTAIPVLILVVMAIPSTRVLIDMESTGGAEMNIKITGYQWLWKYDYIEDGVSFYSALDRDSNRVRQIGSGEAPESVDNYLLNVDNRLVVPVNTKIRFLLTSDDVIHSWWVPALGWKRDAIPGMINEAWTLIEEEGTYRGQCAELCGKDHGFMPIVVEAVSREAYDAWVAEQRQAIAATAQESSRLWTRAELMDHGAGVYEAQCAACHQADGSGLQPAFPALAMNGEPTGQLEDHLRVVLDGREGTAMTGFRGRLEPQDIAAALTYARNAWSDEEGEIIQPSMVAELDQG